MVPEGWCPPGVPEFSWSFIDRDQLFTEAFIAILEAGGVKSVKIPAQSPKLQPVCGALCVHKALVLRPRGRVCTCKISSKVLTTPGTVLRFLFVR